MKSVSLSLRLPGSAFLLASLAWRRQDWFGYEDMRW
jgi:hypothetical protein